MLDHDTDRPREDTSTTSVRVPSFLRGHVSGEHPAVNEARFSPPRPAELRSSAARGGASVDDDGAPVAVVFEKREIPPVPSRNVSEVPSTPNAAHAADDANHDDGEASEGGREDPSAALGAKSSAAHASGDGVAPDAPGANDDVVESGANERGDGERRSVDDGGNVARPRPNIDATSLGYDHDVGPRPQRTVNLDDRMMQVDAALSVLKSLGQSLAEQARSDALEIGFMVARQLLRAEITARIEPVLATVKEAVRLSGESRSVRVRLAPFDAKRILDGDHLSDVHALSVATMQIVPDDTLEPGDVIVETDFGEVDGRLTRRLDALFRAARTELGLGGTSERGQWG